MLKQSAAKNTLVLVGADKGGVGKTLLVRLLLDYIAGVSVRVFDTEPGNGVLKRFYPAARQVNLTQSQDQSTIIDGLSEARVTLVDIAAGLLSPTLHLFQRIGFKQGGDAHLCVMHVLGNTVASLGEIKNTAALIGGCGGADHVLVKNHAAGPGFFEWDGATAKELAPFTPDRLISIGHLDALAAERADKSNQMFAAFVGDAGNSRTLRGLVRAWQADSVAEFTRLGLINLVS